MIETVFHTSENNNTYLYDDQQRLSMLVHPNIVKVHEFSENIDSYYTAKYSYLKKHGLFSKPTKINFKTTISESMVEESIIRSHQIVFEVTDMCNLECTYCVLGDFYTGFERQNSKNIDIHSAIKLLKYVFNLKIKNNKDKLTISFYGGEPLLNISFIEKIVKFISELNREKKIDVTYNMTTNGVLINRYILFLVENQFDLLISLDGNERNDSHRVYRKSKKNSFHQVIQNLDMIQVNFPTYFNNHIHFNAVLHDRNSVKEIYEFIFNKFHKIPQISELALGNIKPGKEHSFNKIFNHKRSSENKFLKEDSNLTVLAHKELSSFRESTEFLKYYSINYFVSNITSLIHEDEIYYPTNTCMPFSKKIFLTNQNKLLPCEKLNHKYSLGEVNENVNLNISEITKRFNSYYEHLQIFCQNCYIHRFCGMCMFCIENLNELNTEKFVCNIFHDKKAFKKKMHRVFSFLEKYPSDIIEILENVVITS